MEDLKRLIQFEKDILACKRVDITEFVHTWDDVVYFIQKCHGKRLVFLSFQPNEENLYIFAELGTLAGLCKTDKDLFIKEGVVAFQNDHLLLAVKYRKKTLQTRRLDVYLEA